MVVTLTTESTATYFNILAPGETEVAFFIGQTAGSSYAGRLPDSGDYTLRVYQMRSAARRGEVARYSLDVEITSADFADGLGGGPDFWEVTGLGASGKLNLRETPAASGLSSGRRAASHHGRKRKPSFRERSFMRPGTFLALAPWVSPWGAASSVSFA
jgi:hypothetical protein